jgi:small subunit ribosomal protein S16
MQRTGRKGQAQFRMIVQDSRRSPNGGNIVELLGSFDPHTKVANINKERVVFFLNNGAQPSDRVLRILSHQKVEVPAWVEKAADKKSKTKNPEKLRKNQPKVEKAAEPEVTSDAEVATVDEVAAEETPASEEVKEEEQPTESTAETPEPEVEEMPLASEAEDVLVAEATEPEPTVDPETEAPKE